MYLFLNHIKIRNHSTTGMNEIPLPVFFIYLYGFKVIGGIFLLESEGLLLAFLAGQI